MLDEIKCNPSGDSKNCLLDALGHWLRLNYNHKRHGRPNWKKLAEAVRSLDYTIFEKIAKKHHVDPQ